MTSSNPKPQDLWAHITSKIEDVTPEIFEDIKDMGIETPKEFDDKFQDWYWGSDSGAEFAEELVNSRRIDESDIAEFLDVDTDEIDFKSLWEQELSQYYSNVGSLFFYTSH